MKIKDNVLIEIDDNDLNEEELILENIFEIKDSVFENNKLLKKIKAPNLKKICNKAFYNCSIKWLEAPTLEYIGDFAFANSELEIFNFSNISEIGKNAFENTKLNEIKIPRSLKKISKYAFFNNSYLVKVEFLSSMTKIKDGMFENCINLKDITFSETINKLGTNVFKNCKKLNQIILPEHLKIIEDNAFENCENLKRVEFNDELEVINDYVFKKTKLSQVCLPSNLKKIGILPFSNCLQLEILVINKIFHNEILDETNSKLKELTILNEKIELVKEIKKVVNYHNLNIIEYMDNSFQVLSKPIKYYNREYFEEMFPNSDITKLMQSEEIKNIFYWESILGKEKLKELNPVSFIAMPPNINIIKAFYNKHQIYDDIIEKNVIQEFDEILATIKFITIFGGLSKKIDYDINSLIKKIGLFNLTKQFRFVKVTEFNQKFVNLYLNLIKNYSFKKINKIMPFAYNNIEKVTNLDDNYLLDTLKQIKLENDADINYEVNIIKSDLNLPIYEWLDTGSITNLLRGYILASAASKSIDTSEDERKYLTYNIEDENRMIVASSRAYYNVNEKYLLFNTIVLSQSFINKKYSFEKVKSLLIEYVLAGIEEIINFLNEDEVVVSKVNVGISEKSLKEQLKSNGTKAIIRNL